MILLRLRFLFGFVDFFWFVFAVLGLLALAGVCSLLLFAVLSRSKRIIRPVGLDTRGH